MTEGKVLYPVRPVMRLRKQMLHAPGLRRIWLSLEVHGQATQPTTVPVASAQVLDFADVDWT